LREMSHPQPPQLADLPRELVDRFVGVRHRYLLRVYARGDIWDMDKLERFVRDVESIDPQVTGHPVQTYYASRHMQQSYLWAGVYALGAVLLLLWIDFRSLAHSLLAMVPLAIGSIVLCGLLGWLDLPLNPANMIALPLILGIGVDDGVHLVHEWRRTRGRFRLSDSTAVALLLTSTTTMASFGSLILARHQGLQSLGQVLTLGVMACLAASLFLFPSLLNWLKRSDIEESAETADSADAQIGLPAVEPLAVHNLASVPAAVPAAAPLVEKLTLPPVVIEELPAPAAPFAADDSAAEMGAFLAEQEAEFLPAEEEIVDAAEFAAGQSETLRVPQIDRMDEPSPVVPRRRTLAGASVDDAAGGLALVDSGTGRRSPLLDHLAGQRVESRELVGVRKSDR
jgi:hypothetical protein